MSAALVVRWHSLLTSGGASHGVPLCPPPAPSRPILRPALGLSPSPPRDAVLAVRGCALSHSLACVAHPPGMHVHSFSRGAAFSERAAMDITTVYQKERHEFGRPVNNFAESEVTILDEFLPDQDVERVESKGDGHADGCRGLDPCGCEGTEWLGGRSGAGTRDGVSGRVQA